MYLSISCVKIKLFKNYVKEKKNIESNFLTILRSVSILCIFIFIHTFGPMEIPLHSAALTKEKKKKKQGLVSTYELHKKIRIMVQMFEFVQEILALKSVI